MTKSDLRKAYSAKRHLLTAIERSRLDDLLLIQLQTVQLPFINTLLSYWPIDEKGEPDTHLFADYLLFRNPGLVIAYPRADFKTTELLPVIYNEDLGLVSGKYNIPEPAGDEVIGVGQLDMVFVPLLQFDRAGFRVGYGKGFYDKFLANCPTHCIKIGFSYFEPVDKIVDTHEFDVPLDLCITPQHVYVF